MPTIYIRRHVESGRVETLQRDPSDGDQIGGRMDSGANNSGPDGHSRETMRARLGVRDSLSTNFHPTLHSRSRQLGLGSALGEVDDTSRWTSTTTTTDDHQMAGGRTLSFSHYTTEGIFIHGGPPLGSFLESLRPQAAAPRRRRVVLEWEFSLTISGNSQIIA